MSKRCVNLCGVMQFHASTYLPHTHTVRSLFTRSTQWLFLVLLLGALAPVWGQPEIQTQDEKLLQLMEQLRSPDADERVAAATTLGERYVQYAGTAMVPLLTDPDAKVRAAAVCTIGRLSYRNGFLPAVLPLLEDPESMVRIAAARVVGQFRNQPAIEPLKKLAGDPVPEVRAAAVAGLGAIRDVQIIQLLLDSLHDLEPQVRIAAANALGEVSQLQNWVKTDAPPGDWSPEGLEARKQVRWDEVKHGLTALIQDKDQRVRVTGVIALQKFVAFEQEQKLDPMAYAVLVDALNDPDIDIRQRVVQTLGSQQLIEDHPQLLNLFLDLLPKEQDTSVLRSLLISFVTKTVDGAYERILPLMQSADGKIRQAALFALTRQDRLRAIDLCLTALADPEQSVQFTALQGLNYRFFTGNRETVTPDPRIFDAVLPLIGKQPLRAQTLSTLGATGDPRAIPLLLDALDDRSSIIQQSAIDFFAGHPDARTNDALIPRVIKALDNPSDMVQQSAIQFFTRHPDPRAYDGLISLLGSEDWHIRAQAASALGAAGDARALDALLAMKEQDRSVRTSILRAISHFDDPRVAPVIIAAVHDPDQSIRSTALSILSSMNSPAVIDTLATILLQDKDVTARLQAVDTLGQKRDSRSIPALITALQDTDARVRSQVVRVLSGFRDISALKPLLALAEKDPVADVRAAAAREALQLDHGNPETVLTLLKSTDPGVCMQAMEATAYLYSDARVTEALLHIARNNPEPKIRLAFLQSLHNPSPDPRLLDIVMQAANGTDRAERIAALRVLGMVRSTRALEVLLAAAKDPEAEIRAAAISALSNRNEPRAVDAQAAALQDADAKVQQAAVKALGSRGDPRALELLLALVANDKSQKERERPWMIGMLANYNDPRAVAILLHMATDKLQREEVEQLGYFDYLPIMGIQQRRELVIRVLERMGAPVVDAVLPLLEDTQSLTRAMAIILLQQIGDPHALPRVQACIGDPDPLVRRYALYTIYRWGDPRSLPVVAPAVQDADPGARAIAALALGEIGDRRTVPALLPLLDDAEADVQFAAAWALGKLGDPRALDAVLAHLKTATDTGVRAQLTATLAQMSDPRATETLLALLKDPDEGVRVNAISGLWQLKERQAVEPLLAIVTAPSYAHAARMPQNGPMSRIRTLVLPPHIYIAPPSDKKAAFLALAAIGDERAIEPLVTLCSNEDEETRSQAVIALSRWNDPRVARAVVAYLVQRASSTQYVASSQEFHAVCADNVRAAVVTPMLDLLRDDNPRIRRLAAGFFAFVAKPMRDSYFTNLPVPPPILDQRAIEPLVRLCADEDRELQRSAQNTLIALASARALPILAQALQSERDSTRLNAAEAINQLRDVDVTVPILPLLKSPQAGTRVAALIALQWAKQAGVAAAVAPLLNDPESDVCFAAACTLASLHDARAFAPLSAAFTDTTSIHYNDWRAYKALGTLGDPKTIDLMYQMGATPIDWVPVIAQIDDPRAITALVELMRDQVGFGMMHHLLCNPTGGMNVDPNIPPMLIAKLHDPQMMSLLLETLRHEVNLRPENQKAITISSGGTTSPYKNQQGAAEILGILGDTQAVEPLIAVLGQGNGEFRKSVITALGQLKDRRAVPALIDTLEDFAYTREACVTALKAITGQDFGMDAGEWRKAITVP